MSDRIYFVKPVDFPFPHGGKYRAYLVYEAGQDILDITPLKGFSTMEEAQAYRDTLISKQRKKNRTK